MPRFGPYKFYSDSITLFFDSDSHTYLREYGSELVPQIGVTTALKIIDKSEYLIPWAAKMVTSKMAAIMPKYNADLEEWTDSVPFAKFLELLDQAKKAPREILDDAGNVGTMAHRSLEDSIIYAIRNTKSVVEKLVNLPRDERALQCCNAAMDWMRGHSVVWKSTEQKVYSREFEFAGTMDGLALVSSCDDKTCCPVHFLNRLSLADWKSANQMSVTFAYQIAAYRHAHMEEHDAEITDAFILRLGKEDGKFEAWHLSECEMIEDFHTFVSCLDLTKQHNYTKDRISAAKKERTARKRLAKKVAEW